MARGLPRRSRAQMVWVGLAEAMDGAEHFLDLHAHAAGLLVVGKRTPTPWVRPPDALAGVIQATLPATG